MQRAFYLYVLVPLAVITLLLLFLIGRSHAADDVFDNDPHWREFTHARERGDLVPVYCFTKTYLRKHIGRSETRRLFRENADARNLCGTLRCRGYSHEKARWMCHFDALVFMDENPPDRPVPPVKAQTPRPRVKRLNHR